MIEFITDSIKSIVWLSIGIMFGTIFGLGMGVTGLYKFYSDLPVWMTFLFFILISIGILFLIVYFKNDKIEQVKK